MVAERAMPTPKRARNKVKALRARPDAKTITENVKLARPMMGGRL